MNQHYEFWVSYYEELKEPAGKLSDKQVQRNNKRLTGHRWEEGTRKIPLQKQSVLAQVCYPGLLVGLGNAHQSGMTDPEIQLGITLDPVTGLPFLPGSTVKGILRSAFLQNREYVACLLEEQGLTLSGAQVEELELDSFGKQQPYGTYEIKEERGGGKDVFLDAFPVKGDAKGHLLGLENITPHRAEKPELEGLTSPVPLNLVKVMPGVVFQFRFQLVDSTLGKGEETVTVTAGQKLQLYRQLLLDLGAGAKTNVGFGGLKEPEKKPANEKEFCYLEQLPEEERSQRTDQNKSAAKQTAPKRPQRAQQAGVVNAQAAMVRSREEIRPDMVLQGRVKKIMDSFAFVELIAPRQGKRYGVDGFLHISEISWERVETGRIGDYIRLNDTVSVLVTKVEENGKKISVSLKRVRP